MGQYSSYQDDFAANTDRYPSSGIWSQLDALSEREGRTVGLWDDFATFPITWGTTEGNWGRYKTFGDSGAAGTDGDEIGGVLTMTEATNQEGMALATTGLPFQLINTGGLAGFEARIKASTISNAAGGIAVGMASSATYAAGIPVTTSGALYNTLDFVGFLRTESDGDIFDAVTQETGVTMVTQVEDIATIAEDTYVKLGFLFEPDKKLLTYFVNGVPNATTVSVSDTASDVFPNDVRMGIVLGFTSGATTPSVIEMDWWKAYQAA